jgi:hypothetical protein
MDQLATLDVTDIVIGAQGSHQIVRNKRFRRIVEQTLGLRLSSKVNGTKGTSTYFAAGDMLQLEYLWDVASNFLPSQILAWKQIKCHLYIDHSNIRPRDRAEQEVMLNYIRGDRVLSRKFIAGSSLSGEQDKKWSSWKQNQFEIAALRYVHAVPICVSVDCSQRFI